MVPLFTCLREPKCDNRQVHVLLKFNLSGGQVLFFSEKYLACNNTRATIFWWINSFFFMRLWLDHRLLNAELIIAIGTVLYIGPVSILKIIHVHVTVGGMRWPWWLVKTLLEYCKLFLNEHSYFWEPTFSFLLLGEKGNFKFPGTSGTLQYEIDPLLGPNFF